MITIGQRVKLKGRTATAMNFKEGIVRRIVKKGGNIRQNIYYISRVNGKFTTPFLRGNIK